MSRVRDVHSGVRDVHSGARDVHSSDGAFALVGFVAVSAYAGDGASDVRLEEDSEDPEDASEDAVPRPGRALDAAQIDRLCVLPGHRGIGVKEALLRVADGFHAAGLPVRVKTASESAAKSFRRCALLAYEGFKDPTRAGVAKSRGVKTVVVVDRDDTKAETETETTSAASRWGEDPEDTRRYTSLDGWRHGDEDGGEPSPVARTTSVAGTTPLANSFSSNRGVCFESRDAGHGTRGGARDSRRALDRSNERVGGGARGDVSATRGAGTVVPRDVRGPRDARGDAARGDDGGGERGGERLDARRAGDGRGDARGTRRVLRRAREAGYGGGDVSRGSRRASPRRRRDRRGGRRRTERRGEGGGRRRAKTSLGRHRSRDGVRGDVRGDRGRRDETRPRGDAERGGERSGARRRAGCRLGGRARFLAERALDALRADDDSSRERADAHPRATSSPRASGFGAGRGKTIADAASPRAPLGAPLAMRRSDVHAAASAEMRVVVAEKGSVAAAARGERRGWMFRYVGSPVRRADGVECTYVAADEGERRGRWVRVERREKQTESA